MRNPTLLTAALFLAGTTYCGSATAQQTPTQTPAQTQTSGQSSTSSTTAKPAATAGTKSSTTSASTAHKATTAKSAEPFTLKTDKDKQSYAIGMTIGKSLSSQKQVVDVDPDIVARGLKDSYTGGQTLLTEEEMKTTITTLQAEARQKAQADAQAKALANQKAGEAFLEANKTKPGVQVLPDGLQYKVITEGNGEKPTASDTVVCNYRGTLIDGTEFDSSFKRGQPLTIGVTGVIKGWTEALQLMPVGSKWELYIPADLAYGPRGAGPQIGPFSTLVFQIELLSIKPKPGAEAPSAAPAAPTSIQPGQTAPQSAAPGTPKN